MIYGIGIDQTEIQRFQTWHTYPLARLQKIFSPEEITYCLSTPKKSAERFAVRFSAKEAFLKAISTRHPNLSLLKVCKMVHVAANDERPHLAVDWQALNIPPLKAHLSLSHSRISAVAIVLLEE